MLSAAEKAEDAFEKETAQEVGEEDDLFAQEDHEEVEPVSKADNTDEDFSWIEEAYGAEDGTDEAEDLGDETDEDESFDDEEDDGGYEAHSMTIVKLRIAVLSQSVRVMYRMLLRPGSNHY